MRIARALLAAAALACGKEATSQSSQSKGPPPPAPQFVLAVDTRGPGMVRGMTSDCRGSCTQRYDGGAQVKLQAVADSGASFSGWSGACSGNGDCNLTMGADGSVTATFIANQKPKHQLTVLADGQGGVLSSPPGIDCSSTGQGGTCTSLFAEGTSVSLTAAPSPGWTLGGWSGACGGSTGCSVTLGADSLVRARFDAIPPPPPPPMVNITVTVDGQGLVSGAGINCPGTCSAKVNGGSSVSLTAVPASGWRFMGFGGACSGSSCTFNAQADTSVSARFEQEVIVLAPADGTNGNVFAINATHVFFQRSGSNIYGIWSLPKTGGPETLVSGAYPSYTMVADQDYVYWNDYSTIWRAPVSGGSAQPLYSSYAVSRMVVDGGTLYWTAQYSYYYGAQPVGIYAGSAAGGNARLLASATVPFGIAVDSQYVYWPDKNGYGGDGVIQRVPKAGGPVDTVIDCGTCTPLVVVVDSDNIYYRNQDGDGWSRAKAGGAGRKLTSGNPGNSRVFNVDLDVNASVAYWTWNDGISTQGLFSARADGTGWKAIDTASDSTWFGPRVDDNYIFYMHAGALYRRLK